MIVDIEEGKEGMYRSGVKAYQTLNGVGIFSCLNSLQETGLFESEEFDEFRR